MQSWQNIEALWENPDIDADGVLHTGIQIRVFHVLSKLVFFQEIEGDNAFRIDRCLCKG